MPAAVATFLLRAQASRALHCTAHTRLWRHAALAALEDRQCAQLSCVPSTGDGATSAVTVAGKPKLCSAPRSRPHAMRVYGSTCSTLLQRHKQGSSMRAQGRGSMDGACQRWWLAVAGVVPEARRQPCERFESMIMELVHALRSGNHFDCARRLRWRISTRPTCQTALRIEVSGCAAQVPSGDGGYG